MDLEAPIIIIGAGRSGSQLLARVLGSHSAISIRDESHFIIPRLWLELHEHVIALGIVGIPGLMEPIRRRMRSRQGKRVPIRETGVPPAYLEQRQTPLAAAVRAAARCYFRLEDEGPPHWGFRELWNGTRAFSYDWLPYDIIFPRARWLLNIRNPFDFARSDAAHSGVGLDRSYLEHRLVDWLGALKHSRKRAETGRFLEIRHEDLVNDSAATVGRMLQWIGLEPEAQCLDQLGRRANLSPRPKPSAKAVIKGDELNRMVDRIPGLRAACDALGYAVPSEFAPFDAADLPREAFADAGENQPGLWEGDFAMHPSVRPLKQRHKSQYWTEQELKEARRALAAAAQEIARLDALLRDTGRAAGAGSGSRWRMAIRHPKKALLGHLPGAEGKTRRPAGTAKRIPPARFAPAFRVNFLIGGGQKCGTTALNSFLLEVPPICMAPGNEPHFFDAHDFDDDSPPAEWNFRYAKHFPNYKGQAVVGEKTPRYMALPEVAERVHRYNPKMRWIILLRNPAYRAISQYNMNRERRPDLPGLREFLGLNADGIARGSDWFARGLYSAQIRNLLQWFPPEQLLILKTSELLREHEATLRKVFNFLGLPGDTPVPEGRIVASRGTGETAPSDVLDALQAAYAEEYEALEALLGWNLDDWRSGGQ